jgi:hypothetical protein
VLQVILELKVHKVLRVILVILDIKVVEELQDIKAAQLMDIKEELVQTVLLVHYAQVQLDSKEAKVLEVHKDIKALKVSKDLKVLKVLKVM